MKRWSDWENKCLRCPALTCAVHVVSGQLEQPHVLVGDGIKGAAGKQNKRNAAGDHAGLLLLHHRQRIFEEITGESYEHGGSCVIPLWEDCKKPAMKEKTL